MAEPVVDPVLAAVKLDLGITHAAKDDDIVNAIDTAKRRLGMIGVDTVETEDATTMTAIKLYCRAWFNFQGDADRYRDAFEHLANAMSHASEYRAVVT